MSKPYERSQGPAMFFRSGCQSSETASQVYLIIAGPFCFMTESSGRYLAQSESAKRETPISEVKIYAHALS